MPELDNWSRAALRAGDRRQSLYNTKKEINKKETEHSVLGRATLFVSRVWPEKVVHWIVLVIQLDLVLF